MPQALKPISLIHIGSWENSLFPLLALWGNKNWLPSMKVKKLEKFQNKMGLKSCKWSSLNAPDTQTPVSHPGWEKSIFPFSALKCTTQVAGFGAVVLIMYFAYLVVMLVRSALTSAWYVYKTLMSLSV